MRKAGLLAVEQAKKDGRWENAYLGSKEMVIPQKYLLRIRADEQANELFKTLKRSQLYSIALSLHTAKKEITRERRISAIIEKLKNRKLSK